MAKVVIDNKMYEVNGSKNMLEICLSLGLNLPYFCWHPELGSVGACRQCAVIKYKDKEDTKGKLVMACLEPVADNMRISLEADEAKQFRAGNVEALMTNHPHDCPVCDEGGECHLQDMTVMTGHNYRRYNFKKRTHTNQYLGPFINHEMNRCIQCYRCVRFYKDYAGGKDLDVFGAHDDLYFGRHEEGVLENEFSGNLLEVCPTGVFTDKTLRKHFTRKWDLTNAPSICHGCALGCNIIASERYGSIRRILSRYNGDVNGYFLCDRGRFGYEYVNSEKRIQTPLKKQDGTFSQLTREQVIQEINAITSGKKLIGIGSPKASLESNFLLRQWVGAENFYAGMSNSEGKLVQLVLEILKAGKVKTPSLNEVKEYDAVFILGEDVTNTAPMLALNLRQAAKNKPDQKAAALDIPDWNDEGVRELVQGAKGPFYIASAHITKLDEIATQTCQLHPDDIARLGYAVANKINGQLPVLDSDEGEETLSQNIAKAMLAAKKPLIVAGISLFNQSIIESAANVASALKEQGKDVGLVYIVPEVNSVGLTMIADQFLDDAFEKATQAENDTLIILENDLYQRMDKNSTDAFFENYKNNITLDYLDNKTTQQATYILPATTFAEGNGTVINNEGRAQRFYQVYSPDNDVKSSWKWLQAMIPNTTSSCQSFDEVIKDLVDAFPELKGIQEIAPSEHFREGTQKIPREPHRYSGRTAMHADTEVSEHQPPSDTDSALSFTMEGYAGIPPAALTPFYWSPGWNSVQAINKYQIEVGGALHGGNPGKRLFEQKENNKADYFENIPSQFSPKEGSWFLLPFYHILGSDELSAQSPAIKERVPAPYVALNDNDASKAGIEEGDIIDVLVKEVNQKLTVKLNTGLPEGTIGLPKGLTATAGIQFPFWTTFKKLTDE